MAQLYYGNYAFEPDSVWFTIMQRGVIGRTNRVNYANVVWQITGRVTGDDTNEVITKCDALSAAIIPGQDLVFSIYHRLLNAQCVAGTQILSFNFLPGFDGVRGSGAELVLRRTFNLSIGGKIIVPADTDIVDYRETVVGAGTGGPLIYPVTSMFGNAQAQQTVAKTHYLQYQTGYSTGLLEYPPASTPIWQVGPAYYFPLQCSVSYDTPQNFGVNQNTGFTTRWRYASWYTSPLVASPNSFI